MVLGIIIIIIVIVSGGVFPILKPSFCCIIRFGRTFLRLKRKWHRLELDTLSGILVVS